MVRGFCRVVGLVKTGLLLACAAAATNITRLRSWAAQVGNTNIEPAQRPAGHLNATRPAQIALPETEPTGTPAGLVTMPEHR